MSFRPRSRVLVAFVAAAIAIADIVLVWIGSQGDFAFDFTCCYQQAGQRVLANPDTLYTWGDTYTFRYSPWAAVLFVPLAPLTEALAVGAWLGVKIAVLVVLALWFARAFPSPWRPAVALLVLSFPPIWHDLILGNISVFTVGVLLAVARWPAPQGGVLFGVLLLLAPKPHLLPVAIWMAARRPRAASASIIVLGAGIASGVAVFGSDIWAQYAQTFLEPLSREFTANVGYSALIPGPLGVGVGVAVATLLLGLAVRRADASGFGAAIASGVVLGPYVFIHYLSGLLVAAAPMLRQRPRQLAPYPWLLVAFPLIPVWASLFGAQLLRLPRQPPSRRRATAHRAEAVPPAAERD